MLGRASVICFTLSRMKGASTERQMACSAFCVRGAFLKLMGPRTKIGAVDHGVYVQGL